MWEFNTVTVYLKDTKSAEPFIEETKQNKIEVWMMLYRPMKMEYVPA